MKTLPISVTVDVRLDGPGLRRLDRIERKLDRLLEGIQNVTSQNEEVSALVAQLGGDVTELRSALAGISGDVSDLKAKIDALPAGQPLDTQTLTDLRAAVANIDDVTAQFSALDASTTPDPTEPAPPADPEPAPPAPVDPDAPTE